MVRTVDGKFYAREPATVTPDCGPSRNGSYYSVAFTAGTFTAHN